jgi:hypothetical protein
MTTPAQPGDKSLGEIAATGFGFYCWDNLSASARADFQRAGEAVKIEVLRRERDRQLGIVNPP